MKVSVVITVFNEEKSVGKLIDSLLKQSKKPNEIVIVDAKSSDKTVEIVRRCKQSLRLRQQKKAKRIKLLVEPGSVAHGRNTAVEMARFPIVASIDAGCVAKRDWLEKITAPLKHRNVGMVAGFYDMPAKNSMQKAMNFFHGVLPSQFDSASFLPSARSVSFRKSIWEKVGGYSEKLDKTAEDTHFFYKLVKERVKIVRVKEARVVWEESSLLSFSDSIKKFYQYAKGDAQAGIWWHPSKRLASHNIKISLIFVRYIAGLILVILALGSPLLWWIIVAGLVLYIFWAFRKVYLLTNDLKSGLWGIIIQFASDFAVMSGFLSGLIRRK